jgi:hypothetical protein
VVPGAFESFELLAGATALKQIREFFSERSAGQILTEKRPDLGPYSKGEKAKEDLRFESPFAPATSHCEPTLAVVRVSRLRTSTS